MFTRGFGSSFFTASIELNVFSRSSSSESVRLGSSPLATSLFLLSPQSLYLSTEDTPSDLTQSKNFAICTSESQSLMLLNIELVFFSSVKICFLMLIKSFAIFVKLVLLFWANIFSSLIFCLCSLLRSMRTIHFSQSPTSLFLTISLYWYLLDLMSLVSSSPSNSTFSSERKKTHLTKSGRSLSISVLILFLIIVLRFSLRVPWFASK
mmetsp:Transcript_5345/g.6372  ORF Transcript_5345/g.6372 Transcript_5345/m.6372 type:complete len:208 (-) Transcript_5345:839-1462(-)